MSNLKLIIHLDLPEADKYSMAELRQLVFDDILQAASINHIEWVMKHMSGIVCHPNETSRQTAVKAHKTWSEIISKANFELEREKSNV